MDTETLPSGARFAFWEDETVYRAVFHVDQQHPAASDDNPGREEAPFRTINAAAQRLQPGEKVVIHAGLYRECVRPARGGTGPEAMIAYEAAPGERVVVRGSEVWTPSARPSAGYALRPTPEGAPWMAELPEIFSEDYNPFLLRNAYDYLEQYGNLSDKRFLRRALQRRGMVFVDGVPLEQVYRFRDLAGHAGAFWVEEPGRRLHVRLPGDADPAQHKIEVTAREQIFAPREFGLGYLRVSGLLFEHAADGLPVPQRAAVSTMRGHHWIIENCEVAWANACGMDIGAQTWDATVPDPTGGHIIRGNTIRQCGVCGLAGALGVHHTLVEGNTFEHIGTLNLERMWECAGLKFHLAEHCLIRGNVFRHLHNALGLWLDCSNVDNRVTGNVFTDIETLAAAVYMEMNFERNLVDHNVFWDIRSADPAGDSSGHSGSAIRSDCNEALLVAHNFIGRTQGYGIDFSLNQSDRRHEGRTGLCRANEAYNNVLYRCPHRVHLGRREENCSDGNLFDLTDDQYSFEIAFPAPGCYQNLAGWQRYFDLDLHSAQAHLSAEVDPETGDLNWSTDGSLPTTQPVDALPESAHRRRPGPSRD